jgi:hypothetical protein
MKAGDPRPDGRLIPKKGPAMFTAMQQAGMITVIPAHGGMHAINCPFFDASTVYQDQSKT